MRLESVTVQGFRSFRESTTVNFHSEHTAIVGRNGSGKSNLLAALAFVLQAPRVQRAVDFFHNGNPQIQAIVEV